MNILKIVGIILIAVGVVALIFQGITYTTHKDVINVGPIHATADEKKTIPLPPVLGAIAIVGGIVLLVFGRKT
jgi:hypothetical protein